MAHANGSHKSNGKANGSVRRGSVDEKTDHTRWRLEDDHGCQIWHYLESDEECKKWPQSTADKYFLNMKTVSILSPSPQFPTAARKSTRENIECVC